MLPRIRLFQDCAGMRSIRERIESSGSESDSIGSDEDKDRRQVCVTTASGQERSDKYHLTWKKNTGEGDGRDRGGKPKACTHCGSTRHDDRGCWQRRARSAVVKGTLRTDVITPVLLVEKFMKAGNARWKSFTT